MPLTCSQDSEHEPLCYLDGRPCEDDLATEASICGVVSLPGWWATRFPWPVGKWQTVLDEIRKVQGMRRLLREEVAKISQDSRRNTLVDRAVRCAEFLISASAVDTFTGPMTKFATTENLKEIDGQECANAETYLLAVRGLVDAMDLYLRKPSLMQQAFATFEKYVTEVVKETMMLSGACIGGVVGALCAAFGGPLVAVVCGIVVGGLIGSSKEFSRERKEKSKEEIEREEFLKVMQTFPGNGVAEKDLTKMTTTLLKLMLPVREQIAKDGKCPVCWQDVKRCSHENDEPCPQCPVRRFACEHVLCRKCSQRPDVVSCPMCVPQDTEQRK